MSDGGISRRKLLAGAGGLALVGGASVAGLELFGGDEPDRPATSQPDTETSSALAARFAPALHYGVGEIWYPVDPSRYASEQDGDRVVSGFDAYDGYAADTDAADTIPDPTVFHRTLRYEGTDLVVVQYWLYAAFDQFTTNFHWHDWELLQVFLDVSGGDDADEPTADSGGENETADGSGETSDETADGSGETSDETADGSGEASDAGAVDPATAEPILFVASAHSRKVPNNEFFEPEVDRPSIISEVGSHSSALGVNRTRRQFERFTIGDEPGDVTNAIIDQLDVPLAYGLPRDEGVRLGYAIPELDGAPIHEHERLPNVDRSDLVPEAFTVPSFDELSEPPGDLPERETGLTLQFDGAERAAEADETYTLTPIAEITDIDEFTGPQLSFEFAVPGFVEDAIASHITVAGIPWEQDRFDDPILDVSDEDHRLALAERFGLPGGTGVSALVARLREAATRDDAPGSNGITTTAPTTGAVSLLESDPVAQPTVAGHVVVLDPEPGEHRLTVNAPGVAPYSEHVEHAPDGTSTDSTEPTTGDGTPSDDGTTDDETATDEATTDETATDEATTDDESAGTATDEEGTDETATGEETGPSAAGVAGVTVAGADGDVVVTPNARATKLRVDGTDRVAELSVTDDFGGRVYETTPGERDAAYVHRDGAYTADVTDEDGEPGAYRVNPAAEQREATIPEAATGKKSLAAYLDTFLRETRAQARALAENGDIDSAVPADARDPSARGGPPDGTATDETPTDGTATDGTGTATDTRGNAGGGNDGGGNDGNAGGSGGQPSGLDIVLRRLGNAVESAQNAVRAAEQGNGAGIDNRLRALQNQLDAISRTVQAGPGELPDGLVRLLRRRLTLLSERVDRAIAADTV